MIQPTPLTGPERRSTEFVGVLRWPFIAGPQMAAALKALKKAGPRDLDPAPFRHLDQLRETERLAVALACVGWLTDSWDWDQDTPITEIFSVWLPPAALANYGPAPDDWLMPVLAPFVTPGTSLPMRTDSGRRWTWEFDGRSAARHELPAGKPMRPPRPSLMRRLRPRFVRLFGPAPGDTVELRRPVREERDGRQIELPVGTRGRLEFWNGPQAAVVFDLDPRSYWVVDKRDLR